MSEKKIIKIGFLKGIKPKKELILLDDRTSVDFRKNEAEKKPFAEGKTN